MKTKQKKNVTKCESAVTVEQIHDDFFTAGEKILAEALKVMEESKGKDLESANVLLRYGFYKTKVVKEVQEIQRQVEMNRPLAERIKYYQQTYPHYKFITYEEVMRICKKYNLVFGSAENFIGDIPAKNIADIVKFKIKKEDTIMSSSHSNSINNSRSETTLSIVDVERMLKEWKGFEGDSPETNDAWKKNELSALENFGVAYYPPTCSNYSAPKISICAPEKDFDMTGKYVQENTIMERPSPPDPVVLYPVSFGYLIITAWGKEASDEAVINPVNN